MATKKKTNKKQKSQVTKKSKSLDSKKKKPVARKKPVSRTPKKKPVARKKPVSRTPKKKPVSRAQKEFKKRSQASKKGWVTRRGIDVGRKDLAKMRQKIRDLQDQLQRQKDEFEERAAIQEEGLEERAQDLTTKYSKAFAYEGLPARMIQETALQHLGRVVRAMMERGITADEGYTRAAKLSGCSPREAYTLFMYVGYGEFVA